MGDYKNSNMCVYASWVLALLAEGADWLDAEGVGSAKQLETTTPTRVEGSELRVLGSGFRFWVQGLGFRL